MHRAADSKFVPSRFPTQSPASQSPREPLKERGPPAHSPGCDQHGSGGDAHPELQPPPGRLGLLVELTFSSSPDGYINVRSKVPAMWLQHNHH